MFAREGAKVVIADMLGHEGRQVAQAIGAAARFEPLDVTKEDDRARSYGVGKSTISRLKM
jgi:3alpha(or 20beta)-hydroxysteroid dehydrogenase